MPAPSDYPDFATDTNYTNGPDAGTATKIEPSSGELAEGHIREDAPSPQKMNWWQSLVGLWVRWLDEVAIDHETRVGDLETITDDHETRLDVLEAIGEDQVWTTNDGAYVDDLSNISSVSAFRLDAIKHRNTWVGSVQITAVVSSNNPTQFTVQIPTAASLAAANRANGVGWADGATAELLGVISTTKMLIRWQGVTGSTVVRANFTYSEVA